MRVDGDLDEEAGNRFRRDGRLASLGEERGVIDIIPVDKRQHARADTNECGVCVAQIHRDGGAILLPKKDFRRVDEEVLLVSVDVWFVVGECVREHVDV